MSVLKVRKGKLENSVPAPVETEKGDTGSGVATPWRALLVKNKNPVVCVAILMVVNFIFASGIFFSVRCGLSSIIYYNCCHAGTRRKTSTTSANSTPGASD
jgi:hypothetical protein